MFRVLAALNLYSLHFATLLPLFSFPSACIFSGGDGGGMYEYNIVCCNDKGIEPGPGKAATWGGRIDLGGPTTKDHCILECQV